MFNLKKSLVMLALSTVCIMPAYVSEAATIVFLPVMNETTELLDDANAVFFDRAVEALKVNDVYELLDDEKADKAIAKYAKQGVIPDQATLQLIAQEAGADAVAMYRIDDIKEEQTLWNDEWTYKVHLSGYIYAYNSLAKKTNMTNRIVEDVERPYSESARFNIPKEVFANSVTREIKRIIGDKKFRFEKPRISKAGQKGNR